VATDQELLCLDSNAQLLWRRPLEYGPLSASPIITGATYLIPTRTGVLWKLSADNGEEIARVETQRPLTTSPTLRGENVFVGTAEGTLLALPIPAEGL